jgi:hypothetical protein
VQAFDGLPQSLVVAQETAEAGAPGEGAFHDPAPGEQDEAELALVVLYDLEADATRLPGLGGAPSLVALVDEGHLDALACPVLRGLGEPADLGAVVGRGRGGEQREQVAQRVHRHVPLRPLLALGPVVAGAGAAFGGGAERAAVQHRPLGCRRAPGGDAQRGTQVGHDGLEHARGQPAPRLLVDDPPRRQSLGSHRQGAPVLTT